MTLYLVVLLFAVLLWMANRPVRVVPDSWADHAIMFFGLCLMINYEAREYGRYFGNGAYGKGITLNIRLPGSHGGILVSWGKTLKRIYVSFPARFPVMGVEVGIAGGKGVVIMGAPVPAHLYYQCDKSLREYLGHCWHYIRRSILV